MSVYNIFLIGFMGTGKSTIASCFRDSYGMEIIEMDEAIAKKEKMSIPNIFAQYGEECFRDMETSYLKSIAGESGKVISCGGGVVLREENITVMKKNGKIVLLTAAPEVIVERVKSDTGRPVLEGRRNAEAIKKLMEERREKYEAAADIVIQTDSKSKEIICEEIMNKLLKNERGQKNV